MAHALTEPQQAEQGTHAAPVRRKGRLGASALTVLTWIVAILFVFPVLWMILITTIKLPLTRGFSF